MADPVARAEAALARARIAAAQIDRIRAEQQRRDNQPRRGPIRRIIDRINQWSGRVCDRPDCTEVQCRAAR